MYGKPNLPRLIFWNYIACQIQALQRTSGTLLVDIQWLKIKCTPWNLAIHADTRGQMTYSLKTYPPRLKNLWKVNDERWIQFIIIHEKSGRIEASM